MTIMEISLHTGAGPETELSVPGYTRAKLLISPSSLDFRLDGSIVNAVRVDFSEITAQEKVSVTHLGVDDGQGGLGIAALPWRIHLHPGRPTPVRLPPGVVKFFDGEEDLP